MRHRAVRCVAENDTDALGIRVATIRHKAAFDAVEPREGIAFRPNPYSARAKVCEAAARNDVRYTPVPESERDVPCVCDGDFLEPAADSVSRHNRRIELACRLPRIGACHALRRLRDERRILVCRSDGSQPEQIGRASCRERV